MKLVGKLCCMFSRVHPHSSSNSNATATKVNGRFIASIVFRRVRFLNLSISISHTPCGSFYYLQQLLTDAGPIGRDVFSVVDEKIASYFSVNIFKNSNALLFTEKFGPFPPQNLHFFTSITLSFVCFCLTYYSVWLCQLQFLKDCHLSKYNNLCRLFVFQQLFWRK